METGNLFDKVPDFLTDIYGRVKGYSYSSTIQEPSTYMTFPPGEVVDKVFFDSYVKKIKTSVENLNSLTKEHIKSNRIDRIVINNIQLTEPDVDFLIGIGEFYNLVTNITEKN